MGHPRRVAWSSRCWGQTKVTPTQPLSPPRRIHTRPISRSFVNITTMVELCSQSIRQKSSVVSASGPCVAM